MDNIEKSEHVIKKITPSNGCNTLLIKDATQKKVLFKSS